MFSTDQFIVDRLLQLDEPMRNLTVEDDREDEDDDEARQDFTYDSAVSNKSIRKLFEF